MNNKPEGSSRLEIEGTNVNVATSNHHDKRTINKDKECIEETNTYTQVYVIKDLVYMFLRWKYLANQFLTHVWW